MSYNAGAYKRMAPLINDAALAAQAALEYGPVYILRKSFAKAERQDLIDISIDMYCAAQFWAACETLTAHGASDAGKQVAAATLRALDAHIWRFGQSVPKVPAAARADIHA